MKRALLAAIAVVAMAGCAKEESFTPDGEGLVSFTSGIETRLSVDGTKWSANEQIGVMMFDVVGSVETIATNSDNINYKSTNTEEAASVSFTATSNDSYLKYPNSGDVKFYAYYPYQSTMTAGTYSFSADMSTQATADFMIASTGVTNRDNNGNEVLTFKHMFSLLTLNITGNDNVTDLKGLTLSVTGLNTEGSYDIRTGALNGSLTDNTSAIAFSTEETTEGDVVTKVVANAIVLPETLSQDALVTFTLGTRTFTISIPSATQFTASQSHTYNIALGNDMPDFVSGATIDIWGTGTSDDLYSTEMKE